MSQQVTGTPGTASTGPGAGLPDSELFELSRAVRGFLPEDEGLALHEAVLRYSEGGPVVEIGTYCGKSTILVAAAARARGSVVYTVDHHRGSEEHQPGWEYHDTTLVDPDTGCFDTLPEFRRAVLRAGLGETVVALVGSSRQLSSIWGAPLDFLFIDGGHSEEAAQNDYTGWAKFVAPGKALAIHDVFPNPADGGRPPYHNYPPPHASGDLREVGAPGARRGLGPVR
uniref:class I SAM-dependent methyltransferase n=1 Tax=Nocardia farcinica TaxID=37329 RepID=UPI0024556A04